MMKPYGRVVVLHLAILLGGAAAMALGSPLWGRCSRCWALRSPST